MTPTWYLQPAGTRGIPQDRLPVDFWQAPTDVGNPTRAFHEGTAGSWKTGSGTQEGEKAGAK